MGPLSFLSLPLLYVFVCASAAPLHSRQTSPITCSNSSAAIDLGADVEGVQFQLTEINPFISIADPAPIFSAQLALLNASAISSKLESLALFPTFVPPAGDVLPPTALDDLNSALAAAQAHIAAINVTDSVVKDVFQNNTVAVQKANEFIGMAVAQAQGQNLGCTVAAA
ncbi:hypothetical protein GGX14DRAFT_461351 [Mycena pura]|uniref:Uncharacterized protein n=1 Tax=Mycena pura TaxID=153505 RepID=A0AAD6V5Y4_9AGAR|nr:hypothetical protein GGX14DRAFT_461351 [Mycena pura]